MRRYCTSTIIAVAWTLSGCSGEVPADEARARDREAASAVSGRVASTGAPGCELLTRGEIEAATGIAPDVAEEGSGSVRACDWSMADGRPLLGVVVGAAHRTYDEYMQNLREQMGPELARIEMSRVEGVGDYAI